MNKQMKMILDAFIEETSNGGDDAWWYVSKLEEILITKEEKPLYACPVCGEPCPNCTAQEGECSNPECVNGVVYYDNPTDGGVEVLGEPCPNCTAQEGEWISVEDRLPEDGEWVIIAPSSGHVCLNRWSDDCGFPYDEAVGGRFCVTHWQPLPAPPKEGE